MMVIKNMSKVDKIFSFTTRVQSWVQVELHQQGVKDIPLAIMTLDWLIHFKTTYSLRDEHKIKEKGKRKDEVTAKAKGS